MLLARQWALSGGGAAAYNSPLSWLIVRSPPTMHVHACEYMYMHVGNMYMHVGYMYMHVEVYIQYDGGWASNSRHIAIDLIAEHISGEYNHLKRPLYYGLHACLMTRLAIKRLAGWL